MIILLICGPLCIYTIQPHVFRAVEVNDCQQSRSITNILHQILHHSHVWEWPAGQVFSTVPYLRESRQGLIKRLTQIRHTHTVSHILNHTLTLNMTAHSKMKILSSINHPHVTPKTCFCSYCLNKKTNLFHTINVDRI